MNRSITLWPRREGKSHLMCAVFYAACLQRWAYAVHWRKRLAEIAAQLREEQEAGGPDAI